MISYRAIEGCCVGVMLHQFGGSRHRNFEGQMASKDEMKTRLKAIGLTDHNGGYKLNQLAVVMAYLTTEQTTANEVLEEIGFTKTGTFKKAKHPDSDLNVWQMAAPDFQRWAEGYVAPVVAGGGGRFGAAAPVPTPRAQPPVVWDEEFEEEDM